MSRTAMVADTWKPLRLRRCLHCKRKFVEGEQGSHWEFCGTCYPKLLPSR